MDIAFAGTGGVFDWEYGNSSALVTRGDQSFLIDCGPSVYAKLCSAGTIDQITHILLTHLHGDHIGSISALILHMNLRAPEKHRATVLYPTEDFREDISSVFGYLIGDPEQFVDFAPLQTVDGVGHVETTGLHAPGCRSFAYYFADGAQLLYFSGDVGNAEVARRFLEARGEEDVVVFHDVHYLRGAAHTHYSDLERELSSFEVYGYHVDPRRMPPDSQIELVASHPELLL